MMKKGHMFTSISLYANLNLDPGPKANYHDYITLHSH